MTCFPNHSSTCQQVPCCASTTNYCIASGNLACLLPHSSVVRYDPIAFLSLALVPVEPYQPLLVLSSACFEPVLAAPLLLERPTFCLLLDPIRHLLVPQSIVSCASIEVVLPPLPPLLPQYPGVLRPVLPFVSILSMSDFLIGMGFIGADTAPHIVGGVCTRWDLSSVHLVVCWGRWCCHFELCGLLRLP